LAAIDGGTNKHTSKFVPGLTLVKLPVTRTVENSLAIFNSTVGILCAVPNHIIKTVSTLPNDPNFPHLWGMHNMGQTKGIEAGFCVSYYWISTEL